MNKDLESSSAEELKPPVQQNGKISDYEKGLVGWDSEEDPHNPQNFPDKRKWMILGMVSVITFLSPLASSIPAPGTSLMDSEFGVTSTILASFSVSVFVLGFTVGPLILSPLSEIYGRQPVLNVMDVFITLWQIGCALAPNIASLIVFRFLAGVGGSACLSVGGGVIADLFPIHQRGKANAMFTIGPLIGPVLGPLLGGFISQRAGWRWVYWFLLITCGVMTCVNFVVGQETNPSVLIHRKMKALRKEPGQEHFQSLYPAKTPALVVQSIMRPLRIMSSPILFLLALYMSFVFGLLYLIFTTTTTLFTGSYSWSLELTGLAYLGIGIGFCAGNFTVAKISDPTVVRLTKANNGVYHPEMRLAPCLFFAPFIPISFFWYGWTADKHVHWIVPIIGLLPFGFGGVGIFASIQTYFIDASGAYAASAVAGLTAMRCLFGAFLPLAGPSLMLNSHASMHDCLMQTEPSFVYYLLFAICYEPSLVPSALFFSIFEAGVAGPLWARLPPAPRRPGNPRPSDFPS
ncbi:hypothetical protein ACN38_g12244 [Penicillium nordicum]|uniref:Major facilitator superfamily (MFS) profile domain-containing protein n=1 Tax=Penicillium nordicum TaxID=229535 RepID=A0A0M8NPY1_9EURO|nr:hypothetical protein ACN38_g12244 [Penicillium nordicum]